MIGIESGKHFACAAFVRTTVVTIIPSPLQRLHGFGYNGIVRIHLSTWLVLQLEGSAHSVPRDVTLPSLDKKRLLRHELLLDDGPEVLVGGRGDHVEEEDASVKKKKGINTPRATTNL